MTRPQNWQEHKQRCLEELEYAIAMLEIRARRLRQYTDRFDEVADEGSDTLREWAKATGAADFGDDQVKAVAEFYHIGVQTVPDSGSIDK